MFSLLDVMQKTVSCSRFDCAYSATKAYSIVYEQAAILRERLYHSCRIKQYPFIPAFAISSSATPSAAKAI